MWGVTICSLPDVGILMVAGYVWFVTDISCAELLLFWLWVIRFGCEDVVDLCACSKLLGCIRL